MTFDFNWLIMIQAHLMIIISLGMIIARVYFGKFLMSDELYSHGHVIYIMLITVFTAELIDVFIGFYFFYGTEDLIQVDGNRVIYLILLPHFIFFGVLCYFLFWLFRSIQHRHSYYVEFRKYHDQMVDELESKLEHVQNNELRAHIFHLIAHPHFNPRWLQHYIFHNDVMIWNGRPDVVAMSEGKALMDARQELALQYPTDIHTIDEYTIIEFIKK